MSAYKDIAKVFKAFSDERRIEIIELLSDGERCACVLLDNLDISQSTLSHHMKILCDSNIVVARKEGKWTYYTINKKGVCYGKALLDKITKGECD